MVKTKDKQSKKRRSRKCFFCGGQYGDQDVDIHMHSYVHHEAIQHLTRSGSLHACRACDVTVTGLKQYKEHISSPRHKYNLYKLQNKTNTKDVQVNYNISLTKEETVALQKARRQNKNKLLESCFVCCRSFPVQNLEEHMHGIIHHQKIETLKGSAQVHKCWACWKSVTGMALYEQHVDTFEHEFNLFVLQMNAADGNKVDYSAEIDDELRQLCDKRDQRKKIKKQNREREKEGNRQKTKLLNHKSTNEHVHWPVPIMENTAFTNDHLPPTCHLFSSWEQQNSASTKLKQNVSKRRHESTFDMDDSHEPLVKRPCLETSAIFPQEVTAVGTRPCHEGEGAEVWVNTLTRKTEDGASIEPTWFPGLSQSRSEDGQPNLTTARGVCTIQKETIGTEADVPRDLLQRHTHSNESTWKLNKMPSQSEQDASDGVNEQQPYFDSLPTFRSETFESQTLENDRPVLEAVDVRPHTVCFKEKKSHESVENHNSIETNSCKLQKAKKKDISHKSKVNQLLLLSSKEDELTKSLERVSEKLIKAYSTLESIRAEVQRLLAVKQQVTSTMASLREKRLKILQEMKNTSECSSNSDQQVVLNTS